MSQAKLLSLFLTGAILMAGPAFAASVTQDGATQLQQRFTKELASRKDIKLAGGKADFKGDVAVLPKEGYYEVTLPYLKVTDAKANSLDVGKIVMNMMPTDTDTEWKSSVSLPATLAYTAANPANSGKLRLGSQKASGIWDMGLFGFKKLNASYGDVGYRNVKTNEGTQIANLSIDYDFAKSDTEFSGPVNVTANDVNYVDTQDQKSLLANSLKINSQVASNKAAVYGFTQTSQAEIGGLSNAINLITTKLNSPGQANAKQLNKALGVLSVFQMAGKPAAGNDVRSYNIVTDAQGRTTLNGVDVSLLLGAASIK